MAGLVVGLFCSCKGSGAEVAKERAPLAPEPERFQFTLPPGYLPRELRGDGSETLQAPSDAEVRARGDGVSVEAGPEFAVDIQFQPTAGLPATPAGSRLVFSESDLVVFGSNGTYSFVVLRELVPEWDESERRRIACGSAGAGASGGAAARGFPRTAIERMVAACRTLALPRLE